MTGRSILLNHDELIQAKNSSKQATWIALSALFITIFVGIIQILKPIEISQKQFRSIDYIHSNLHRILPDTTIINK